MASYVLTGNDFVSNSNSVIANQDGTLNVNSLSMEDFSVGIVSRDSFDLSTGNKSVKFVFRAEPKTLFVRKQKFGSFSESRGAVLKYGDSTAWSGVNFDSAAQGEPDCLSLSKNECETFYDVDSSETHTIVKTGSTIEVFGDNNSGELDLTSIETIKSIACGNGFTVVMRKDGVVELLGDDKDGNLAVPDSCVNFSDVNTPIKISACNDAYCVLKKDGTVEFVGYSNIPSNIENVQFVGMSSGSLHTALLSLDGNIMFATVGEDNAMSNIETDAVKVSCSGSATNFITSESKIMRVDSESSDPYEIIPSLGVNTIDTIAGPDFSIVVFDDMTIEVIGSSDGYSIPVIDGDKIGWKGSLNVQSDEYDMYPFIKNATNMSIFFGVQNSVPNQNVLLSTDSNGTQVDVIKGTADGKGVFDALGIVAKGAIVNTNSNSDVYYETRGDGSIVEGHKNIAKNFITKDENEVYEAVISFSSFGKHVRFRKNIGDSFIEYPVQHLSVMEEGFVSCKPAIYIKNVKNLSIEYVEVTDSVDTGIVPADVIYRDTDTSMLQTKAAQMVEDLVASTEALKDLAIKTSQSVRKLNLDYNEQLDGIFERLNDLESN